MSLKIERGFISRLLSDGSMTVARDNRITPSFFSGDDKNAYEYILNVSIRTGEMPTIRAFRDRFPHYKLEKNEDGEIGTEENLKFWIDELRRKKKQNYLADCIEESAALLQEKDSDKAMEIIKKGLLYLETEIEETDDVDITKDLDVRKEEYLKKKKNKGMMGIPTGFKFLDYMLKGLVDETLTTLIARTGEGKTWFEVLISSFAMVNGYKVLQFVTEMPEKQMRDRYEVVLYAMTHGAINYSHFKSGKLSTEQEKDYFDFLDSDLAEMTPLELITATSPMQVEANIEKYNPDLVMIDGVYLMEDDEGSDSDWLRIAHITRDLKKIAKRKKKPIFINSQLDKNTSKKTGAELGNISYSQAIAQDSDNVMALFRTPLMCSDHEMCVKLLKTREGSTGKLTMTWDFSNMQFEEIYNEKSDGGEISDKEDNDEEIEEDDSSFVDVNRGGK